MCARPRGDRYLFRVSPWRIRRIFQPWPPVSAARPAPPAPPSSAPRKRRVWPWLCGGIAVAGGGLVLGLLLAPPVQGWLVRRLVRSQPGWRIDFESFGAGPRGLEVRGLDFDMPGVNARSAPIAVRIAPGRLFNKRELKIERVEAHRLLVTVTPADLAGSASEPFAGLVQLLQSPLAWAVDDAQLDGEIAVRDGGQSIVIGTFVINGGGISAEQVGAFTYELAVNSAVLPLGPDNKVRSHGVVRLTQGANHGLSRITIEGDLTLPRYGALALPAGKFNVSVSATENGEDYHARLELGTGGTLEFNGRLDAPKSQLNGRATLRADPTLVASMAGENVPAVQLEGSADISSDLKRGDVDLVLAGTLSARDWAKLAPELAVVDAFKGKLAAAATRRGGKITVSQLDATLAGESSPTSVRVSLTQPVDPRALPDTPLASLTIERVPLGWANPWFFHSGLVLDPSDMNGAWSIRVSRDRTTLQLDPLRPVEIAALGVKGAKLPPLPAARIAFSPRLTVSAEEAALTIEDFSGATAQGDQLSAQLAASHHFPSGRMLTHGELSGAVPTLLSGAAKPSPFALNARWDAALTGAELRINTLEAAARRDARTPPYLSVQLLQPLTLNLNQLTTPSGAATDWVRLRFDQLPLDWTARWLPRYDIAGTLASGESLLRSSADGQLTFATPAPWRLTGAALGVGGKTFFAGEASIAPQLAVHADHYTVELQGIEATDRDGSRIRGSISAEARLGERKGLSALAFEAELPALPHSAETFGPVFATLRAKSHNETDQIAVVDEFELRVRNRARDLFTIAAPAPFLAGRARAGMLTAGTVAPLQLTTGELPLAWLKPWVSGFEAEGTLQPSEFAITAELTKFLVRPLRPVQVRDFSARVGGRDIARAMEFSFYPGLDLTLICIPSPVFQLAYAGTGHLTNGAIDVTGKRAVDVDAAVSFVGNDQTVLPSGIEYSTRADFAELSRVPALAGTGLPSRGSFVARVNGDLLGQAPLELWTRIEGVLSPDGRRTLPALEVTAHGHVNRQQKLTADVALRLETEPRVTDARFEANLNLAAGNLEIASGFHSTFFDASEALALFEGLYSPPKTAAQNDAAPATAKPNAKAPTYAQQGVPFWSHLRGRFDLDLGLVRFAPYQVEHLRGRLDLRERELLLSDLRGEMFSGRWGGRVRVDYQPENKTADHQAVGEFRIEQFDSARVVQTVFPTELASVDARIDVHSTVRSRGNALLELIDRAEGEFTVEGRQGIVRLNVPKQEMAATAAVFGGTVLLSPELRALGRLLKKFAEMPVDQLRISGERKEGGEVQLSEFRLDSPQARLLAHGKIPAVEGEPLMNRPLELSIDLAAKDEMAVILGGMSLIEKKPRADGFRPLKEKFQLRGKAGAPDTRPLYDLFAKAVMGSKGTWGFLMRKVQEQVNKTKPPEAKSSANAR